MKISFRFR